MKAIFITGTDTGVGKSVVSGLLGRYLLDRGYRVITQKWIETGTRGFSKDIGLHLRLMRRKISDIKEYLPYVSPYAFRFASSPHLATALEKKRIDTNKIKKSFRVLEKLFDFVIVEGVGGALVPLNKKKLVIDIAKELSLPVLIVVGNRLGAINHTLLTIEAVKKRGMKIEGIIFNNRYIKSNKVILKDNIEIIRSITGEKVLGVLPPVKDKSRLYGAVIPAAKRILKSG